MLKGTYMNR